MNEPDVMERMLRAKTIAVIGVSADEQKPSHYVATYLQGAGHEVLPVNPAIESVLGVRAYGSLSELPVKPDVVNVFRLPKFVPAIVDEMIAQGLTDLWLQQGIVHEEAVAKAEAHGIGVVMDRCMMVESRQRRLTKNDGT